MEEIKCTIQNEHLKVIASTHGAELHSVMLDGHEYLWQGDPAIWKRHSPVLFPFVGRFTLDHYKLHGREYPMTCHGFCQDAMFSVAAQSENSVCLELTDSEATYANYPFHFSFQICYTLHDKTVAVSYAVVNKSDEEMYFGLGAHPGFLVPMEDGLTFEDYFLEFPDACRPDQIIFTDKVLVSAERRPYPIEDGKRIPLHHDLFDNDAVVLEHSGHSVCLRSDKGSRSVTISYPQMPYVGFWHAIKKEAPYVCVEPWVSLPSRDGVVEEFSARADLVTLPANETYHNTWTITLQ